MFLRAVCDALKHQGNRKPETNIFGCDIDRSAFFHLAALLPQGFPEENFRKADFLKLNPESFKKIKFDAVVGNPPYISYHDMSAGQRRSARRLQKKGIPLGPIASLWAYFVSHSVSFLIPHGRMGWVLPGSLVDADYGEDLLKKLAQRFSRVVAIKLQQRCFAHVGTDESSVVLLCEDLLSEESTGEPNVEFARDVAECAELIDRLVKERATGNRLPISHRPKNFGFGDQFGL